MESDRTYNRLIEILYGSDVTNDDLKRVSALAAILVERRSEVTSAKVQQDFEDAIVEAGRARQAGKMPPDELKAAIRALFLDG